MARWAARVTATLAAGAAFVVVFAGVAAAHVEVAADPPVAGANNSVLTFTAEAESPSSGVVSVSIALPEGLTPNDVNLNKAPDGWKLTDTADGYMVAGPSQPQGQEVVHSIIVTHLPPVSSLTFKAVVTYADGTADHWIDEKTAANPDPAHPAPVLQLQVTGGPGAAGSPTGALSVTGAPTAGVANGSGTPWWWYVIFVAVALGAVLGTTAVVRRRRDRNSIG